MSRRSLPLRAYRTYARGLGGQAAPLPEAPQSPCLLVIGQGRETGAALAGLVARLQLVRPDLPIMGCGDLPECPCITPVHMPLDRPGDCEAFVARLQPVAVIWCGEQLRPCLLDALDMAGAHMTLLSSGTAVTISSRPRWLPDVTGATLGLFDVIHAVDSDAARMLRREGVEPGRIRITGALVESNMPLECDEDLRDEMAMLLGGRPVWLAAHLHPDEAQAVIRAHRQAARLEHRLLLVAVPEGPAGFAALCATCEEMKLRVCTWDDGAMPDENTQVLLTETPEELGLWLRLAPLVFMGQSLVIGTHGRDPFEAASLGAAVLYGPNVGDWLSGYSRLVSAGAARIVRDAESLGAAVTHLIAPDQAASMAHAGWEVVSAGAALVDTIIAETGQALDESEVA